MIIAQDIYTVHRQKDIHDPEAKHVSIPAFINSAGELQIGHNGTSEDDYMFRNFEGNVSANEFEYFCDHLYRGAKYPMEQFLRNGIPYELMRVENCRQMGGNLLFTFLQPCRDGTYFCTCNECGKKFVIDCYESPFYLAKGLNVPTVRCRSCINAAKKRKTF